MLQAIEMLQEPAKTGMTALLLQMDDDFWEVPRREQVLWLIVHKRGVSINQTNIAEVMDVNKCVVTKIKHYLQEHPGCCFSPSWTTKRNR